MEKVAMLRHEKACVACRSMATFICLLEKKRMLGSIKTCACARGFGHKRKKKRATNFELFGHLLPFFFLQNLKI